MIENIKQFYTNLTQHEQSAIFTFAAIAGGILIFIFGLHAGEAFAKFIDTFNR
jgi:hypothetical protein